MTALTSVPTDFIVFPDLHSLLYRLIWPRSRLIQPSVPDWYPLGNFEAEDSEAKQKYDAQVQINLQLQEQKKWLEHELEEVRKNTLVFGNMIIKTIQ